MVYMGRLQSFEITAHQNIYSGDTNRSLRIDYVAPVEGINQNTGLLILVPGFGGNIDSTVYKKNEGNFCR